MNGIEVNINPEDVQAAIVQAVTESTIGKIVAEEIEKHFTGYNSRNFWRGVVHSEIEKIVNGMVQREVLKHEEQIKKLVAEQIDDQAITKIVFHVTNKIWGE